MMKTSFQDHSENSLLITLSCYKYCTTYPCQVSTASASTLNDHRRFLFLYSFKTKCMNITLMYVLHALNLKLWLRSNPVSKCFMLRSETKDTVGALKTRGIKYSHVETWLLFAPPIKISGYASVVNAICYERGLMWLTDVGRRS